MKKGIIFGILLAVFTTVVFFLSKDQDNKTITEFIGNPNTTEENISPENGKMQELENTSLSKETNIDKEGEKMLKKPEMQIDKSKKYIVTLSTTEGQIVIELFTDKMPITVNNFIYLAKNNFYDNTIFHRVIKDFMIQGGDPKGDGTGGPGYKFEDEPFSGEYLRGVVAMANSGPNTNGSQFFIMHADYPLPKNYVIFGKVIEGLDVVDKIASSPVKSNAFGEMSTPVSPVKIESTEIMEE